MKNKITTFALLSLLSLFLGLISGAIVWIILKLITLFTDCIWKYLPAYANIHPLVYNLIVCCIGAVAIVLLARKFGDLPDLTEDVMATIKKDGGYPYNRLPVCALAAVIPLVFGGTLGPEAGLVGVIAGLCCWVGDNLKYRGSKLQTLAETGFSVALSIVFMTPLAGIVDTLEPDNKTESYIKKISKKRNRIFVYCIGVAGGFLAFFLLNMLLEFIAPGFSEGGLPRFTKDFTINLELFLWLIPIMVIGVITGFVYNGVNIAFEKIRKLFKDNRIFPALIAAVCLAVCGFFFPEVLFSGEHQLGPLIENWPTYSAIYLLIIGLFKLILSSLCINFGWRGGAIFPIIFGTSVIGFSIASFAGINGFFAAAVSVAAAYAYINRKPGLVTAILLLCFPPTYIPLILVVAIIASRIPNPFVKEALNE